MGLADIANKFKLAGLKRMEGFKGCPKFTWKDGEYSCVPDSLNVTLENSDYSFEESDDFEMTVRLGQFTDGSHPNVNEYITYLGYKMLIKGIKKPDNIAWVYICKQPTVTK